MTLPKRSKKRQAMIDSGAYQPPKRKPMKRTAFTAKQGLSLLKKPKKETKSKAMKAADKWFSEWIRLRDSDEHGIATCITSGRRAHWREMDCGHYLSRAKMSTRYDERNCHAQSKMANRFQGGHFMEHGFRIEEKYGRGTCHALAIKAMQPCKRSVDDFDRIADHYKRLVGEIKSNEPDKYQRIIS